MTTAHVHTVSVVSFSFVLLHHELTSLFAIFDITFWYFIVSYGFRWTSMVFGGRWFYLGVLPVVCRRVRESQREHVLSRLNLAIL